MARPLILEPPRQSLNNGKLLLPSRYSPRLIDSRDPLGSDAPHSPRVHSPGVLDPLLALRPLPGRTVLHFQKRLKKILALSPLGDQRAPRDHRLLQVLVHLSLGYWCHFREVGGVGKRRFESGDGHLGGADSEVEIWRDLLGRVVQPRIFRAEKKCDY